VSLLEHLPEQKAKSMPGWIALKKRDFSKKCRTLPADFA
jgi:hypothetical protein